MVDVSVIIPTKNDGETLEKCLRSIADLNWTEKNKEVIIVDGYSTDDTVEIAKKFDCRVLYEHIGTRAGACNIGVNNALGKFILFTDADCIVPKDWIRNLLGHFDNPRVASVGGPNLTAPDDSPFGKSVGTVIGFLSRVGARYGFTQEKIMETFHNPSCNVAYRKEIFEKIGGFNEQLITCEDEELDYRIKEKGHKIIYTPHSYVFHYRRGSYGAFGRQALRYGKGRAQSVKIHPRMGKWFHYVPLAAMFLIATSFLLSFANVLFLWLALSILVCGAVGILLMSSYLCIKTRTGSLIRLAALITIWFLGFGFGFLKGLLTNVPRQQESAEAL
jgi:cellulose synthase/poly-beta-1,6-N-acetylglucosamine synthase-like glycosyltransferase